MLEDHEGNVQYEVAEEEDYQKVVREGILTDFSVGRLDVEEFLDTLLVHYHFGDVFVLVFESDI